MAETDPTPPEKTPWESRLAMAQADAWKLYQAEDKERLRELALKTLERRADQHGITEREEATEFTQDGQRWLRLRGVSDPATAPGAE